jgi:FAD:protein FMN transferase
MSATFRAMGTDITVVTDGTADPAAVARATVEVRSIFEREEDRFSRFRDESELSAVNRLAGRWIDVSPPFAAVVSLALDGATATDGAFDPTVLPAMVAAGYDRDFREIEPEVPREPSAVVCGRWREMAVDGDHVFLPAGVGLDLGGLAKGWTADLAAAAAVEAGLPWVIVNAGGDLRIAGATRPVDVGIEEPTDADATCCVVRIHGGALATSSITRRRWAADLHHLIDPRIGRPLRTPVLQATVWAPTCAEAEIHCKRAMLEGVEALEDLDGVVVLATGEIVTNLTMAAAA